MSLKEEETQTDTREGGHVKTRAEIRVRLLQTKVHQGLMGGSDGKASVYNAGDLGLSPGLGIFPEGGLATHFSILAWRFSHGQRSLVRYSLWGRKELDTTERLHCTSPEGGRKQEKIRESMALLTPGFWT